MRICLHFPSLLLTAGAAAALGNARAIRHSPSAFLCFEASAVACHEIGLATSSIFSKGEQGGAGTGRLEEAFQGQTPSTKPTFLWPGCMRRVGSNQHQAAQVRSPPLTLSHGLGVFCAWLPAWTTGGQSMRRLRPVGFSFRSSCRCGSVARPL